MTRHRKDTLRTPTEEERRVLGALRARAVSFYSHVARAKILLAVADGATYQGAAYAAGAGLNDVVAQLVARFNAEGLAATRRATPGRSRSTLRRNARAHSAGSGAPDRERGWHGDVVVEQFAARAAHGAGCACRASTYTIWVGAMKQGRPGSRAARGARRGR